MSWSITHSWQAEDKLSCIVSAGNDLVVCSGLELQLLDVDANLRWRQEMPFLIHAAAFQMGKIGVLCGHGFFVVNSSDGGRVNEGRSTRGGFSDILARPGGGWILSCREGNLHLFNEEGRGLRRLASGKVRRLLGWFDREHLLWQDDGGRLRCARLAKQDSQRVLEERIWSWVSRMFDGRCLLQSSDGSLWEGIPHPFGWDSLDKIQDASIEPLSAIRSGDGWWLLGIDGVMTNISGIDTSETFETTALGKDLGHLLVGLGPDTMVTANRQGLLRYWNAPHLAALKHSLIQKMVADAKVASDWDERRRIFQRARTAEEEGRVSLAINLYQTLGRKEDVKRLLSREREDT